MKKTAPFAAALTLSISGVAGGQPVLPDGLAAFQRDADSITPYAYESFKAGGPDLPEKIVRLAYEAHPGLKRYDEAFRKVMDEVRSTVVTGKPAVWLVYNMGVVVKTPRTVFAIDLLHRQGLLMEPLLDFALVTHNHDDHADDALLALMDRHRKTVVSNFLCNYGAHKGGKMPGGYMRGEGTLTIGDVTIRATPSDHNGYLREFTSAFEITVGDWTLYHTGDSWRPSMLNPSRPPDLWVCHPRNGLDIVKCVKKFHPRRTVIAHLNELGHQGGGRVGVADALEIAAAIEAEGTEAVIPVWGERIDSATALTAAVAPTNGVLCLTFDDSCFSEWEAALPIFAAHGAHATFFAYHAIDDKAVASLRRLSEAGHSIGLHGLKHQKAPDVVATLGEEGYFADEIEPQLSAARAVGLPIRSFAYPMSCHTPQTDALLLRHFDRLRGGGDFNGPFSIAEAAARRYLPGLGIGPNYKRGGAEVAAMLPEASASNAVLVLYSHGIGETAEGVSMSRADLETILSAAEELGMAIIGFDELDALAANDVPCPSASSARALLPESAPKARPGTTVREDPAGWLEVTCDGTYGWPGVELRPKGDGTWDLSRAGVVEVVVSNMADHVELISAEVFPKNRNEGGRIPARCASVPPGTTRLISVQLADTRVVTDMPVELDGTNGKIGSAAEVPDFSETPQINVFQVQQGNLHPLHFAVLDVRTRFEAVKPVVVPAADFFPFCDRYGQFRHVDWPGKVHSDAELLAARDAEEAWLAAHAASPIPDADQYGGWAGGPQLEATGFFRTEKVDGKWWLVDPEGHLFFSLGVTAVYAWTQTRVNGRENYFEWIPGTLGKSWRNDDKLADFLAVNLTKKYGDDFKPHFADTTQRRFRAWGINTVGNWSHEYIWALRRTPYVVTVDPSSKNRMSIREKKGIGATVPDVYSPQFAEDLRAQLQKLAEKVRDDPWCIGIFVDNELDWASPENIPDAAEKYFSTIAAEVKAALPNHLYLGSRLVRFQEDVWRAAARHCDVVSFNFYERHPTWDLPPDAEDKPIIVGEFHFGALDRGHLAGGCAVAFDQNERAQCFKDFVNACLDNPRYVGCHWFQYTDQAMTGRYFDGEAYQCGFVSVTDAPYPELVEACRETAAQMYERRMGRTFVP